ncbi:MAG: phosphoribosylformylglycinamidine synthase subunit PurS, partial [Myxococcota bacterium]
MPHRIEVALKPEHRDPAGEKVRHRAEADLGVQGISSVRVAEVYNIDGDLTAQELDLLAREPFSDCVIQTFAVDRPVLDDFDWAVEVGYMPGVTDNVGRTATEAVEVCVPRVAGACRVYTSRLFLLKGTLTRDDAARLGSELLANELIQSCKVTGHAEFAAAGGFRPVIPRVRSQIQPKVETVDVAVSDEELIRISRDRVLVLSLAEMKVVQEYYRRPDVREKRASFGLPPNPTDVEIEVLAQTWSEHCKHKIFNATIEYSDEETGEKETVESLFDSYIKQTTKLVRKAAGDDDICISVFKDNAGVITFDDKNHLVF